MIDSFLLFGYFSSTQSAQFTNSSSLLVIRRVRDIPGPRAQMAARFWFLFLDESIFIVPNRNERSLLPSFNFQAFCELTNDSRCLLPFQEEFSKLSELIGFEGRRILASYRFPFARRGRQFRKLLLCDDVMCSDVSLECKRRVTRLSECFSSKNCRLHFEGIMTLQSLVRGLSAREEFSSEDK